MARILIIEDEIIIARFIELQLHNHFDCTIRIAVSETEVTEAMEEMLPQLILCDINLGEVKTGIDLITELRHQYTFEVIYITSYQSRSIIEQASATAPSNYIIKPVDEMQLYAGVKLVMDKMQNNPQIGTRLSSTTFPLNPTELKILQLIRSQKTTKEIAATLHLSPYTIKNHRHKICRKLNLKDENNALLRWTLEHADMLG